jgi:hypothetical protein
MDSFLMISVYGGDMVPVCQGATHSVLSMSGGSPRARGRLIPKTSEVLITILILSRVVGSTPLSGEPDAPAAAGGLLPLG